MSDIKTQKRMGEKLTLDEVCELVCASRPTIYRRIKKGTFPAPIKVPIPAERGPKTGSRWDLGQVIEWIMEHDPEGSCVQDFAPSEIEPREAPRGAFVAWARDTFLGASATLAVTAGIIVVVGVLVALL